ncbi:hypothetical protein RhoFasB10_00985 [Rhodococcus sp. B10]|nr:hypothetical protein [Rhodococcus sp. B10]
MTVDKASLTIESTLGEGGFGTVYLVKTSSGSNQFAYKEFKKVSADELANLDLLVTFRKKLSAPEKAELDSFAAWPLELVTSKGATVGYLMEVLSDRFIEQSIVQTSGTGSSPRSLDWLAKPDHAARNGASLVVPEDDIATRTMFAAKLVYAFNFLHKRGIVFGDVSLRNILHADAPAEIKLIDLDSVRIESQSPNFRQPHSTGMLPKECREGQKEQTIATDMFKVAYVVFSILASVVQVSNSSGIENKVDDAGMTLFGRALNGKATERPSAAEWYRYLYDRVAALMNPPELSSFTATPRYQLRGEPIQLAWEVEGHRSLKLEMPSGEVRDLGGSASNTLEVLVEAGGQYRLTAENDNGTVTATTATVRVFDVPHVKYVDVPVFKSVHHCSLGVSDADMRVMTDAGTGFDWVDTMMSTTLPAPPLPFDLVGNVVTPAFGRDVVDWSGLSQMVDDAFRPPKTPGPIEKWVRGLRRRLVRE